MKYKVEDQERVGFGERSSKPLPVKWVWGVL